jgi:hypothetical protein
MKKKDLVVIAAYIVGIALIITGQSVYRYATQTIADLEAQLSPSLSQEQYSTIQSSLDWWRPALVSFYGPISIYLIYAGIATLAILTVYIALKILRR